MKQPIKMTPGDELHLTALMAPFSLNLVTGQDRQHLLSYGRAAFDAGKDSAGKCLHQIQEPAPVQAAPIDIPAYGASALSDYLKNCDQHSIVPDVGGAFAFAFAAGFNLATSQTAPAAVAVPDERAAFEAWAVTHYAEVNLAREGDGYRYALAKDWWPVWQARAALAATPAADATVTKDEATWCSYIAGIIGCYLKEPDDSPRVEAIAGIIERRLWALPSPKPAAAPVVLPEPFALYDGEKWYANEEAAICSCANMQKLQKVYTEQQVRALLAGVSAPAALAVERGEVLVTVSGFTGSGKSAIAGEIEIMCRALGLQVEWPDSDSEKHMTHADWIAALEQYKPRVRIVECNVPHSVVKGQDK